MARLIFDNNATTALSAPVLIGAGVISVVDGAVFTAPNPANDEKSYITIHSIVNVNQVEVVELVSIAGNDLTVVKGIEGGPYAFAAGDIVEQRVSAGVLDALLQVADIYVADAPPPNPRDNQRWIDSTDNREYHRYNDGVTTQWVELGPQIYGTDAVPPPAITAYDLVQDAALASNDDDHIATAAIVGSNLVLTKNDASTISVGIGSLQADGTVAAAALVTDAGLKKIRLTINTAGVISYVDVTVESLMAGAVTAMSIIGGNTLRLTVKNGAGGTAYIDQVLPAGGGGTADGYVNGVSWTAATKTLTITQAAPASNFSIATVHTHAGSDISSPITAANVPALDASKTTTGVFADARIPSLAASKTTSGVFDRARIPAAQYGMGQSTNFVVATHAGGGAYVLASPVPKRGNLNDDPLTWVVQGAGATSLGDGLVIANGRLHVYHGLGHTRYIVTVIPAVSADVVRAVYRYEAFNNYVVVWVENSSNGAAINTGGAQAIAFSIKITHNRTGAL